MCTVVLHLLYLRFRRGRWLTVGRGTKEVEKTLLQTESWCMGRRQPSNNETSESSLFKTAFVIVWDSQIFEIVVNRSNTVSLR